MDEPTTGLHFADVEKLIHSLHRLAEAGNTVVTIEHNLEIIKEADYLVDLGPEGGDDGGYLVASGSPLEVAQNCKRSYTARYLQIYLNGNPEDRSSVSTTRVSEPRPKLLPTPDRAKAGPG